MKFKKISFLCCVAYYYLVVFLQLLLLLLLASSPIEMNAAEINKDALLEYAIELGVYFTDDEVIITDSQLL